MPEGTRYADFANVHNYIYHPSAPGLADNKTWNAADPTSVCKVDGLFGNYGPTWGKKFRGYEAEHLDAAARHTETGCTTGGPVTEEIQALNLLSLYLDQFKRGWSRTAVYLLRDRSDEGGNQTFGFFRRDYAPRNADTRAPTDPTSNKLGKKIGHLRSGGMASVYGGAGHRGLSLFNLSKLSESVAGIAGVADMKNRCIAVLSPAGGGSVRDRQSGRGNPLKHRRDRLSRSLVLIATTRSAHCKL